MAGLPGVRVVDVVDTKNQDPDIIPLAVQMEGKPGGQLLRLDQVCSINCLLGLRQKCWCTALHMT